MMKDKRLLIVMVMLMTTFIGFGIIIPVLPELIKEASPGSVEFHTGMMLSIYSAVSFLISPFWGGLSDKIGRRPVILMGARLCRASSCSVSRMEVWRSCMLHAC